VFGNQVLCGVVGGGIDVGRIYGIGVGVEGGRGGRRR
jgi:hypothetical protein